MEGKLIIGLVFLLHVYAGSALQCYECYDTEYGSSNADILASMEGSVVGNDPDCRNGDSISVDTVTVKTCTAEETMCGLFKAEVEFTFLGFIDVSVKTWLRGCHKPDEGDAMGCTSDFDAIMIELQLASLNPKGSAEACACDTDLCNSAPSTLALGAGTLLLSLLAHKLLQ